MLESSRNDGHHNPARRKEPEFSSKELEEALIVLETQKEGKVSLFPLCLGYTLWYGRTGCPVWLLPKFD